MTGLVSRAPGGPQLTTGLSTVWMSSTGGLEKTGERIHQQGAAGGLHCRLPVSVRLNGEEVVSIGPSGVYYCFHYSYAQKNSDGITGKAVRLDYDRWGRGGTITTEQIRAEQHKFNQPMVGQVGRASAGVGSSQLMSRK